MLMILARLVRSESFWAVAKVRSPHTGPEPGYPRRESHLRVPGSGSVGVDGKCGDGRQRACLMAARGKVGRSERLLGENERAMHRRGGD